MSYPLQILLYELIIEPQLYHFLAQQFSFQSRNSFRCFNFLQQGFYVGLLNMEDSGFSKPQVLPQTLLETHDILHLEHLWAMDS